MYYTFIYEILCDLFIFRYSKVKVQTNPFYFAAKPTPQPNKAIRLLIRYYREIILNQVFYFRFKFIVNALAHVKFVSREYQ